MKTQKSSLKNTLNYTNRLLVGMVITLTFTLSAFEYTTVTTHDNPEFNIVPFGEDDLILPPITYQMDKVEKQIQEEKKSDQIEIVDNTDPITKEDELVIDPIPEPIIETNPDLNKYGMGDEIIIEDEIPVVSAEVYAHYDNCKGLMDSESYTCATQEIMRRIRKNFIVSNDLKREGGNLSAYVQFVVDKKGNITNVEVVRSNHPSMSKASKKAVEALPQMYPATQKGRPVKLLMTVPIQLTID